MGMNEQAPQDPTPKKKQKKPKPEKAAPEGETKGLAEQKRIFNERKKLKADLKSRGIKSRKEFNAIAADQGLVFFKSNPVFMFVRQLTGGTLAGMGIKLLAIAAAATLMVTFVASTITEEKGSFTINLTGDMLDAGFILSDTGDFAERKTRLISERMEEVNNITLDDISSDVNDIDGPHNGAHYVAYTFYIKNEGKQANSYEWRLKMTEESKDVTKAVWVMVFEDDKQLIYTRAATEATEEESAVPEELYGFSKELKFAEAAKVEQETTQYYSKFDETKQKDVYGVKTKPYYDDETVAYGLIENVPVHDPEKEPNYDPELEFSERSIHKYTIVIWIEGYDPDCTDDIFGGFAKFEMEFENVSEDSGGIGGWFDGVFQGEKHEETMS